MRDQENLRPLESVILRLRDEGYDTVEIAKRIGKKPGTVDRVLEMIDHKSDIPEQKTTDTADPRPVERVIRRLREEGETYGQIGNRLNRSGDQIKRIEGYADIKDDLDV